MREKLIKTALGEIPADLVLKNAKVLNIFTGEIIHGSVAVIDGYIAGVGQYEKGKVTEDLNGAYLVPGFINTHCHVESSMVTPDVYCREELRHGTTTLITDPHEIANVAGIDGVRFMIDSTKGIPIRYYAQAPSCVPATEVEHSGAVIEPAQISELYRYPQVLGLGEMMNYPGVLSANDIVMEKFAVSEGRVVDGHAPGLSGKELNAYASAGAMTDHENISFEDALDKLRVGMAVLVREGSACKDLGAIIPGIVAGRIASDRLAFCTDDKHIADIRREGTIRHCVKKAIGLGLSPVEAYRMAAYNAAKIYGLRDLGAIAPGFKADMVVVGSLSEVDVKSVYFGGKKIMADNLPCHAGLPPWPDSVNFAPLSEKSFDLKPRDIYPVIELQKDRVATKKRMVPSNELNKLIKTGEILKIAVVERHQSRGSVGVGLISGYGLKKGAVASTVAHDSHNLIIIGTDSGDMLAAARHIKAIKGGYAFIRDGVAVCDVPLPVYGLMSAEEPERFISQLKECIEKVHEAGVPEYIEPFLTLSFMALPVIPEIRITDMGVFDVTSFSLI